MRICIVTSGQLGSNPRVVKEADALVEAGYEVTVVCTRVAAFVEPRDQAVMARARFAVQRVRFDRALPRRLARIRQEAARMLFRMGFGDRFDGMALSAMTPALASATCRVPADLYIAHYPPALPAAALAAARHHARFAYDAEDFHLGDLPDRVEYAQAKSLIRAVEGRYLPRAAHVTAASPMIAEAYARTYKIALPTTVLNAFPRTNAPAQPTSSGSQRPGPSLYWFSQVIGPGRGIETAIQAVSRTRASFHLYLRGTLAHGYRETLLGLASSLGVSERLHLLEPIEPHELEKDGARFDVGYAGDLAETENRQIALTNKLFSYLTSGLPIVASRIPAHSRLCGALGDAVVLFPPSDAERLAVELDLLFERPGRIAEARRAAWELGQGRYSWEVERDRLLAVVRGIS